MDHIEISHNEAAVICDLLYAYLSDGTHPVNIPAAEALQRRLVDLVDTDL